MPDLSTDQDENAYGILIQDTSPDGDSTYFRSLLENTLDPANDIVFYQNISNPPKDETASQNITDRDTANIQMEQKYEAAANFISNGINAAGSKIANIISWGTPKIQARLEERRVNDNAITPSTVPENIRFCLRTAKIISEKTSNIANRASEGYNTVLKHIGGYLAPRVNHFGVKTIEEVLGKDTETAKQNMDTLSTTVLGIHHVFSSTTDALRNSTAMVGDEIGKNSLKLIETR